MTPTRKHLPIHIPAAHPQAPLGAQQKKFNSLTKRIATQRELLVQWDEAVNAYRVRHGNEFLPQLREHLAVEREQLQWLDQQAYGRKGLTKAERTALREIIADLAWELAESADDEATHQAMTEIHDRYADVNFATGQADAKEQARSAAQAMFGIDLEGVDINDEEAMMRHLQAQFAAQEEQQAQAEAERAARQGARRAKKPSARERKAQEEAAQATQSVREIYRKLASSLHPDRESDPVERERKTALMQRVNQAYAANKLLDLLQLQLEIEQIDTQHIAGLSEERLKHYNRVLAEQLRELEQEREMLQHHFYMEFGHNELRAGKPQQLLPLLRSTLQQLRYDTIQLQTQLRRLRDDPAALKPWIRAERERLREEAALDAACFTFGFDPGY
ncbi:MAG: J domain-containing protein [Proteobacteria bacterium]|nr:J domain-containing protein [Pseudomonadota bacterium]